MTDWSEGFHRAVGDWLDRTLPVRRPYGDWRPVATVLSVEEELNPGTGTADVSTPISAEVELTITWIDDAGQLHSISDAWMLTDLMRELDQ